MAELVISEEPGDGVVFMQLRGYVDEHTYGKFQSSVEAHLSQKVYNFIMEVRELDHISSAGAGVFVESVQICQNHGGDIVLVRPQEQLSDIFEVLGVLDLFPTFDSRAEAEAYFARERV